MPVPGDCFAKNARKDALCSLFRQPFFLLGMGQMGQEGQISHPLSAVRYSLQATPNQQVALCEPAPNLSSK